MTEATPRREVELTLFGFGDGLDDGFDWKRTSFLENAPTDRVCCFCGVLSSWTAVLLCGHRACTRCFDKSVASGCVCAVDGKDFQVDQVSWKRFPRKELDQTKILCWNASRGCDAVGPFLNILQHFRSGCKYHTLRCRHCGQTVPHEGFTAHMGSDCILRASATSGYVLRVISGVPAHPDVTNQLKAAASPASSLGAPESTVSLDSQDDSPPLVAPKHQEKLFKNRFLEQSGMLSVSDITSSITSSAEESARRNEKMATPVQGDDATSKAPLEKNACGFHGKQEDATGYEDTHIEAKQPHVSVSPEVECGENIGSPQEVTVDPVRQLTSVDTADLTDDDKCHSVANAAAVGDDQKTAILTGKSLGLSFGLSSTEASSPDTADARESLDAEKLSEMAYYTNLPAGQLQEEGKELVLETVRNVLPEERRPASSNGEETETSSPTSVASRGSQCLPLQQLFRRMRLHLRTVASLVDQLDEKAASPIVTDIVVPAFRICAEIWVTLAVETSRWVLFLKKFFDALHCAFERARAKASEKDEAWSVATTENINLFIDLAERGFEKIPALSIPLYWDIEKWSQFKEKALVHGKAVQRYTGRECFFYGYMIVPGLKLENDKGTLRVRLVVFVRKGDYDERISWPIKKQLVLTFLDPSNRTKMRTLVMDTRTAQDATKHFMRPVDTERGPVSSQRSITVEYVELSRYIVDDKLTLKFEVKEPPAKKESIAGDESGC